MATIYRSMITSEYRTRNLLNFYNLVGDDDDKNTIYMMFGRSETWGTNENDINFAPPYPDDSADGQADMWANALGLIKIPKEQLKAVTPRRDWGDPTLGDKALQFDIGDIVVTNTINVNTHPSALLGYMVYRCTDIPDIGSCSLDDESTEYDKTDCIALGGTWNAQSSSGSTNNIPHGTGSVIDTEDGYLWEYLYTIPPSEVINSVTSEYIICPFPDDVTSNPSNWGLDSGISFDRDINRVLYDAGVYELRFKSKLTGTDFPELTATNTGYRQIGIVLNPLLYRTDSLGNAEKATKGSYSPDEVQSTSGDLIYMENRQPIYRSKDQVEEFSLIFRF